MLRRPLNFLEEFFKKLFTKFWICDRIHNVNRPSPTEKERYDNLPESKQDGEWGERLEGNIDAMQNLVDSLEEVSSYVDELDEQLGLRLYD